MKLKKIIAGVVTCALAVSCLPSLGVSKIKKVHANVHTSENTFSDLSGKVCRVVLRFNGDESPGNSNFIRQGFGNLFDGNDGSLCQIGVGNSNAYDKIQTGDYIGVVYEEETPLEIQNIRIKFIENNPDDYYKSSVLQYTADGTTWQNIDLNEDGNADYVYGDVREIVANVPDETLYARGIRLLNTEAEGTQRTAWLQVGEFRVDTPITMSGATLEEMLPSNVAAKTFSATDQVGNMVKFFIRQNGGITNYSGNVNTLFDNNTSSSIQFRDPNITVKGDYFGVYYYNPITVERVQFVFGSDSYARDCFATSHFEYYDENNNGWVKLSDKSFTMTDDRTKRSCKIVLDSSVTTNAIRLVKDSTDTAENWLNIAELMVNFPGYTNYEANDVDYYYIKTVTEGSANSSTVGANDGPGLNVIDGDNSTLWHTNYDLTNQEDCWIQFELEEAMLVDGVRVFLRGDGTNGFINAYDIETSVDGVNYTLVCSGTWNSSGWRTAKFEPTTAKYVRLTATDSDIQNLKVCAAICEMRITTPTSNIEYVDFLGGGLRRASTYEKTNMRFGYEIPNVVEGMNATSWEWSWVAEDASKLWTEDAKTVSGTNSNENEDGTGRVSNLVITGIPKSAYKTNVYAQLAITYTIGSEELTVYTDVQVRTVEQVANAVKNSEVESPENKDYAQGLLDVIGQ